MNTLVLEPAIDDERYEVVDGVKLELSPVSAYETVLGNDLALVLGNFAAANGLGRAVHEVLFDLAPVARSRRPDVAFIAEARWPRSRPTPRVNAWPVVPNLAVEVVSPTDVMTDLIDKADEYFRAGVERVWVALPDQCRVYVYAGPTDVTVVPHTGTLAGDPVLPGFALPVADWLGTPPAPASP